MTDRSSHRARAAPWPSPLVEVVERDGAGRFCRRDRGFDLLEDLCRGVEARHLPEDAKRIKATCEEMVEEEDSDIVDALDKACKMGVAADVGLWRPNSDSGEEDDGTFDREYFMSLHAARSTCTASGRGRGQL